MSTSGQDSKFGMDFLEQITEWIGSNMSPDEVFSYEDLQAWALEWAQKQESWITDPDKWATENGYVQA